MATYPIYDDALFQIVTYEQKNIDTHSKRILILFKVIINLHMHAFFNKK